MTLFELNPASESCQRWTAGTHSWRRRGEGGFDADRYGVAEIPEAEAKTFVLEHHYSGTWPAASRRYGLFDMEKAPDNMPGDMPALVGVAVLGVPVQASVLTGVFPDLDAYTESLELARFVLLDEVPGNAESWFLAQCFAAAAATGLRGIVSFADPVPRAVGGRVIFPGHRGVIYMASNAVYTGRATPRSLTLARALRTEPSRSMQKVRSQERGHDHVEARLVALGAPVRRAGQTPAAWLAEAAERAGATRIRHGGNHRYAFRLGTTRRARQAVRIALPTLSYPKGLVA